MGIAPPFGIMLYGPPGTGKTMLAKAVATAAGCSFINVEAWYLMTGTLGEGEKRIQDIFVQAKANSPCILFFDEFQAIFGKRDGSMVRQSMGTYAENLNHL